MLAFFAQLPSGPSAWGSKLSVVLKITSLSMKREGVNTAARLLIIFSFIRFYVAFCFDHAAKKLNAALDVLPIIKGEKDVGYAKA